MSSFSVNALITFVLLKSIISFTKKFKTCEYLLPALRAL
jgi:hypothetical protein